MLRLGVQRTVRNWKVSLAIFLGIFLASALFAGTNIEANIFQDSLLTELLADIPADMMWHLTPFLGEEIPNATTLVHWSSTIEAIHYVENTTPFVINRQVSGPYPRDMIYTTAILSNASIYDQITLVKGKSSLGVNETYIATSSSRFNDFPLGSSHTIQFLNDSELQTPIESTLRVVGYVNITEHAEWLLSGLQEYINPDELGFTSFFIVDLEKTFNPLLEAYRLIDPLAPNIRIQIAVNLDRNALIRSYNMQGTIVQLNQIVSQIQNLIPLTNADAGISNLLGSQLLNFQDLLTTQRLTLTLLILPIVFVTFYLGVTLGDVTFSLRRREIGLLLARAGTNFQLTLLYLLEASIIGVAAGFFGIVLAVLVVSLFIGIGPIILLGPLFLGLDTIGLVLIFGAVLAVFSIYVPARKALKIPMLEALGEYTATSRSIQYHKKTAWLCLILGTYKILTWIFGLNVYFIIIAYQSGSIITQYLLSSWIYFEAILTLLAPLLFVYGFLMVIIKGSPRLLTKIAHLSRRAFRDLGAISSHNLRYHTTRTAATLFLLTMLVGFSVQSIGHATSSEDWIVRSVYTDVGADIRVKVQHPDNISTLLTMIRGFEGVHEAAAEYILSMDFGIPNEFSTSNELRAINPDDWLEVAYFEEGWFWPGSAEAMIRSLDTGDNVLIFERLAAAYMNRPVGSLIDIRIWPNQTLQQFFITGFFGPEPIDYSRAGYFDLRAEKTWSYTSIGTIATLGATSGYECYILIRLTNITANEVVLDSISSLDGIVQYSSAIQILDEYNSNLYLSPQMRAIQLVVFFSVILTMAGTMIIQYLSLLERRRVTALMCQRGGSYRQMLILLVGEVLTLSVFATIVGLFVGFVSYFGLVHFLDFTWPLPVPVLVSHQFLPVSMILRVVGLLGGLIILVIILPLVLIPIEVHRAQSDISVLR